MIVREYTAPNGVRVRIHDDAYAGASEEELARRRAEVQKAIAHIYDQVREHLAQQAAESAKGDARAEKPEGARSATKGEQTGGLLTCTPAPQYARAGAEKPEGARSATKGEQTGGLPTCTPAPQYARAGAEKPEGARSATKGEQTGGLPTCTPAPRYARAGAEKL